jgi:hypothetical protein
MALPDMIDLFGGVRSWSRFGHGRASGSIVLGTAKETMSFARRANRSVCFAAAVYLVR